MPQDNEFRAEAERLALLPRGLQRQVIDLLREVAGGKGVPANERRAGLERAAALERLLKLTKRGRRG